MVTVMVTMMVTVSKEYRGFYSPSSLYVFIIELKRLHTTKALLNSFITFNICITITITVTITIITLSRSRIPLILKNNRRNSSLLVCLFVCPFEQQQRQIGSSPYKNSSKNFYV